MKLSRVMVGICAGIGLFVEAPPPILVVETMPEFSELFLPPIPKLPYHHSLMVGRELEFLRSRCTQRKSKNPKERRNVSFGAPPKNLGISSRRKGNRK